MSIERRLAGHREHFAHRRHLSVNGTVPFWPTSNSTVGTMTVAKPASSGLQLVLAGRQLRQTVFATFVGDRERHGRRSRVGRGDGDAGQNGLRFVDDGADDAGFLSGS